MKERPILFSGPMVRALLDGTKTQTRRLFADRDVNGDELHDETMRERNAAEIFYRADDARTYETDGCWRPSIHMPRWASRITLEITGVRVQRLQDISAEDCIAEGIEETMAGRYRIYGREADGRDVDRSPRTSYASLWESINGAGSWGANPWVWALAFKRIRPEHSNA